MSTFPFCFLELKNTTTDEKIPYSLIIQEDPHYFIPHRHNYIEFSYVIKGTGYEIVNNERHSLERGTFSLLLPYQVHALYSDQSDPITFYVGAISLDEFYGNNAIWRGIASILFGDGDEHPAFVNLEGDLVVRMETILHEMFLAYGENTNWGQLLFKAKLVEALILFDRARIRNRDLNAENKKHYTIKKGSFWDVVYHVQTHYTENISLKELSLKFHVSVPYISMAFKKHIGDNYLEFLNEIRIQNACALMVSSELTIAQIAYEVGYESYETFSRVFLKRKGMSARVYRLNNTYL